MKDLLSVVLVAVYALCIYRYSAVFLGHQNSIADNIPSLSWMGILILGIALFTLQAFIETAFEGWLIVIILVGGAVFFLL